MCAARPYGRLVVLLVLLAGLNAGCYSQIPVAQNHPLTFQKKMQAAHHWDVLADDVATRVETAIKARPDLQKMPIHVALPNQSAFAMAFHELLISQLVFRGLQVSVNQEDSLVLNYGVQRVKHHQRFQRPPPGLLTAVGAGVWAIYELSKLPATFHFAAGAAAGFLADIAVGTWATESDNEVIITTSMEYNNRYVMHTSALYYINDPDYGHYAGAVGGGARTVRIINE